MGWLVRISSEFKGASVTTLKEMGPRDAGRVGRCGPVVWKSRKSLSGVRVAKV